MCGRGPECDSTGTTPRCVDHFGHSEPGALYVTCKAGKYCA